MKVLKAYFNKLLAKDPNNTEAAFWLGQTYLDNDGSILIRLLQKHCIRKCYRLIQMMP